MDTKSCEEFTAGLCPAEEFHVENVTIKCPYAHVRAERENYVKFRGTQSFEFEQRVLGKYKEIIREVESKIVVNRQVLERETLSKEMREALDECKGLIEGTSEAGIEKVHGLLAINGMLLESIKERSKAGAYDVCGNCSAFKERGGECKHMFCQKYRKLRETANSLEKKLSRGAS